MKKIKHEQCISYITVYHNMFTDTKYYHMLTECESGEVYSEIIDCRLAIKISHKLFTQIHDNIFRYTGDLIILSKEHTKISVQILLFDIFKDTIHKGGFLPFDES